MKRTLVYQIFCGRGENANVLSHPSEVLKRLQNYHWQEIKQIGIDYVYLLSLWDNRGPILVTEERGHDIRFNVNRYPSPFSISDHTHPNPDLGTLDDLILLIDNIHQHHIKVLVDFVPNHTSTVHPWVNQHPEYYKSIADRNAFSGDVYELDYTNLQLQFEMIEILQTLLKYGVDGFRVDMAHLIPAEFWQRACSTVKTNFPEAVFLAEAYSPSVFDLEPQRLLLNNGFDAVYDEPLYRNLHRSLDHNSITAFMGHYNYISTSPDASQWCHYLQNHDDDFPCAEDYFIPLQALVLASPGWHFIYEGSLQHHTHRLAHHTIDILDSKYSDIHTIDSSFTQYMHWIKEAEPEILQIINEYPSIKIIFNTKENSYVDINFQAKTWYWHKS